MIYSSTIKKLTLDSEKKYLILKAVTTNLAPEFYMLTNQKLLVVGKYKFPRFVWANFLTPIPTLKNSTPPKYKLSTVYMYISEGCGGEKTEEMANTIATLWVILTQFLLLVFVEGKNKVPAIIVFGDSSVHAGNNNQIPTIARSNFELYGRDFDGGRLTGCFSNGRIPTDFISEAFGLRTIVPVYLDPAYSIKDFAVGVMFASARTGYDNATSDVLSVIPLW
ncbi:GDSL esterase/lipase At2g04570-like [Rhododendron vialii]|uniref:GDSL esterase/lipase At2g04570-like n=1 Tax=Rhododendron vialii TaxID=182163 RepID=UPI00266021C4|nr:GDSL esterase/lipase At2g04570-like [Rhododendron vialii]